MKNKGQSNTKTALFYTIAGRIFQIGVGLGTLKVQTYYLSKEQVGEFGLFLNIATLLLFVTFRPLNQYFNRRLHEWFESGNLPFALKRLIGIQFIFALLSVPIIAVSAHVASIHTTTQICTWAAVWACWYFFNSVFNTVVPAFNLLGFKQRWVLHNSAGLALGLAMAWIAMLLRPTAFYWTAALAFGFLASSIVASLDLFGTAKKPPAQYKPLGQIAPLNFLIPATIAIGGTWVQFQAFRLFAADFMTLGDYGLFIAGYGLAAGLMAAFEGLAAQYLLPFFYAGLGDRANGIPIGKQWGAFAGTMMTLTSATCLIAFAYGPLLCKFLLSNAFQNAWPYFFIGIFLEGTRVISGSTALGTHVTMQVHHSLRSYLVGIFAITAGIALGHFLGSLALFTAVVAMGCVIHLVILTQDVSGHLHIRVQLLSPRYLAAMLLVVTGSVLSVVLGLSLVVQGILIALATIFYVLLLLEVNSEFSLAQ
jgi:O-antigen/teichoic acid export membrane protein